ncbi:MAG TPA: acyl-CoA dehydrogenase family protein [Micromonosporaceae bacterium]
MENWYSPALETVLADVVAPAAADIDRDGSFPHAAVAALGDAGILGLVSATQVGGGGGSLADAARVVERLATGCGSTAMVALMHYAATAVLEAHGPTEVRKQIAAGKHLATLAFSEPGSRSHFWASASVPVSEAGTDGVVVLDSRKSWVTSAGEADSYVWSTRPLAAPGPMTLWLVPRDAAGLRVVGGFDGLGLRGNGSCPMTADGVRLPADARLGDDGAGLELALPWFLVLSAAFSVGLAEATLADVVNHVTKTRLEHLDQTLAEQPVTRNDVGRIRLVASTARALLDDTLRALAAGREDATLRVLEVKAVAAEAAIEVTDRAMKVCGGAAFRKEIGLERRFRDARAARVMAPTSDALTDFVARAVCGMPLFDPPAGDPAAAAESKEDQ